MSKRLISLLVTSVALSSTLALAPAKAADKDFCRAYTDAAMRQVHEAREHPRCHDLIRDNPARWQDDYQGHFNWCLSTHRDDVERERDARTRELDGCARG